MESKVAVLPNCNTQSCPRSEFEITHPCKACAAGRINLRPNILLGERIENFALWLERRNDALLLGFTLGS